MKAKYFAPLAAAALIIAVLTIGSFLKPDRDFSDNENRTLQQRPVLTRTSLMDGDYTADAEDYMADQILLRDFWMGAKSSLQKLSGRRDINGVWLADDGYYFSAVTQEDFDTENYEANLDYIAQLFAANEDRRCAVLLAPSPAAVLGDLLPAGAQPYDSDAAYDTLYAVLGDAVIDPRAALADVSDPYYRTDHHWTTRGALAAYSVWCDALGEEARSYTLTELTDSFRGTMYSRVLLPGSAYDSIYAAEDITIRSMDCDGTVTDSLYDYDSLAEKDKYTVFMGGNWAKVVIDTGADTGRSLLVIKDSFANSFLPFLTAHYDTITVLDLRYTRESVQDLADECTDILVLYEMSNFASDTNIFRAAMT